MRSVWHRDPSLPEHPALAGDVRTDVLVIGGGLAGLLTAWELCQRGREFFEIFMQRMVLCRKAAERLGLQFKLIINEQQLI